MPKDLCEICSINEFKYRCPGCLKKTCSLECSKSHKKLDSCTGQSYNPVKYVSSETLKNADDEKHENNYLVQRDFNFLTNLKRQLEVQKLDGMKRNKRTLQSSRNNGNNNQISFKRAKYEEECSRVIRRGVNCLVLPRGMYRSTLNKSRWDKNSDLFVWSIEWIVCPSNEFLSETEYNQAPFIHVSHKVKETVSLIEGMSNVVFEKCCLIYDISKDVQTMSIDNNVKGCRDNKVRSEILLKAGLKFYTKQFPYNITKMQDSKELVELDAIDKCIGELFRNRTVIEFPTIYIAKAPEYLPKGFKIVEDNIDLVPKKKGSDTNRAVGANNDLNNVAIVINNILEEDDDDDNNEAPEETSFRKHEPNILEKNDEKGSADSGISHINEDDENEDDYDPTAL